MENLDQPIESVDDEGINEQDEQFEINQDQKAFCDCAIELLASTHQLDGKVIISNEVSALSTTPEIFNSNNWVNVVLAIQHWLGLDKALDHEADSKQIVKSLFIQIPPGRPDGCFTIEGNGAITLTPTGLGRLLFRIEKAVEFMNSFSESVDGGISIKKATNEWETAWEEEGSQIRRPISELHADVTTLPIKEFREYAREGKLDLNPAWQRDIVWSNKDSCLLITSILRGIPLPSIILLKDDKGHYKIVDGKQRLTAILRFMGEHPKCTNYVKTKGASIDEFRKDFKKFLKKNIIPPKEQEEHLLPFRLGKYDEPGDPLAGFSNKYYTQIKDMKVKRQGKWDPISELFESQGEGFRIPVLIFKETKLQDIHQVFSLYNRQGKKLNAEELRNAMFHQLQLSRLLIVLSGDRSSNEVINDLVPFLSLQQKASAQAMGMSLEERGFGTGRFKRTKVLGWAIAILLHAPNDDDEGGYITPSTAAHIDSMLKSVQDNPKHPMYRDEGLVSLCDILLRAVEVHSEAIEAWPPKLRNTDGIPSKWGELSFVAALLSVIILVSTSQEGLLLEGIQKVRTALAAGKLPGKNQNSTQWQFIASEIFTILNTLDVDQAAMGEILLQKFGHNCLTVLQKMALAQNPKDQSFPNINSVSAPQSADSPAS